MKKEYTRIRETFKWASRKRRQRASKKSNDNSTPVGAPPSNELNTVPTIAETGLNENVSYNLKSASDETDLTTQALNGASTLSTPAASTLQSSIRARPLTSTVRASTTVPETETTNRNSSIVPRLRASNGTASASSQVRKKQLRRSYTLT